MVHGRLDDDEGHAEQEGGDRQAAEGGHLGPIRAHASPGRPGTARWTRRWSPATAFSDAEMTRRLPRRSSTCGPGGDAVVTVRGPAITQFELARDGQDVLAEDACPHRDLVEGGGGDPAVEHVAGAPILVLGWNSR
jgi:hypothetical protein